MGTASKSSFTTSASKTTTTGAATALTTTTTSGASSSNSAQQQPKVSEGETARTSFFDIFLSKKQIERNQKHQQVLKAIKAYAVMEKKLIEVNNKLDNLIRLLDVATDGGTKSSLLVAANEARQSLVDLDTLLTHHINNRTTSSLHGRAAIYEQWAATKTKTENLKQLRDNSCNFSKEVMEKISKVLSDEQELNKKLSDYFETIAERFPPLPASPLTGSSI